MNYIKFYPNGSKIYYKNNLVHRDDGPALEYFDGTKYWYQYGKYHRDNGPAVEYTDGSKYWYYYGEIINCFSTEEFIRLINLKAFW